MNKLAVLILLTCTIAAMARRNELIKIAEREFTEYDSNVSLPQAFTWGNKDGVNYLTKSQNQHIPQYCGSCWNFAATSAFSDRVKIARGAEKIEFFLSTQWILNCGNAGSCNGGDQLQVYKFAQGKAWPLDTANPYIACSSDSKEGFCRHVDTSCSALNTARACGTFGEACVGLDHYPNATVKSYGSVKGAENMKQEIYKNGPVAGSVNAEALLDYHGGVYDNSTASKEQDHSISIVGWGYDEASEKQHWIIRNSWGEYWGELGYFRVVLGENQLGLEEEAQWATLEDVTVMNYPCDEDGKNCKANEEAY